MIKTKTLPNRNKSLLAVLGIITAGLAMLQILVFVFFSSQAVTLTQINQEKEKITRENHQLEKEITQLTSLPALEERAKELGFIPPVNQGSWSSIIYLAKQLPIAAAN